MRKLFICIVSILIYSIKVQSQTCKNVLVTGCVIDTLQPQNFYNLMLVNKSTGRGVFGHPDGNFNAYASTGDTILLSIKGYATHRFIVVPDSNCQYKIRQILTNRIQEQQVVYVKPLKSIQQIKEERSNLSLRETRTTSGIDILQSPITALYERFSPKEQSKQKAAKLVHVDKQQKIVKELLMLYVSYDIIQLDDSQFEQFISFLNISEDFLKTASDLELITYIKDKLDHFKREVLPRKQ